MTGAAAAWLAARARATPHVEALRFGDLGLTWQQLARQVETVASTLAGAGVVRGDIVAACLQPHPRLVALFHAAQMLGAALLPLNLRLAPAELERILAHAAPRVLVEDEEAPTLSIELPYSRRLHAFDKQRAPAKSFAAPGRVDPDAALTVVYTSGTTDAPKGVVLTNANYFESAGASRRRLGHGAGDAWLATLPLFHVGGLAMLARSVLEGSCVLLERGFDAGRAAAAIETGDATMISMVPTMLARVLERMGTPPSPRLRCVLVGGAALAPALGRRALDAGLPIAATYGMTEACSQVCTTTAGSDDAARGLVGRPLDGMHVAVERPDAGGWGEILVRGPGVMRGYLRNPQADALALPDGWLHTGDIGRLDTQGRLAVAGRRDDLIVSGGENVAPVEVEQVLDAHPDVEESLVFGIADDEWGQRVIARVVPRAGRNVGSADLAQWCRGRIAGYKIPREFRFTVSLPRSATGKLLRRGVA